MENIRITSKNIYLIASGKGGVGKSTVAANLAIALARDGQATGLLDADLYGPSIPLIMGATDQKPQVFKEGDTEFIEPIVKFGVKIMSLGFLVEKKAAVIWRGPMASNALEQLLGNTRWGELDNLIIDMPPGTGDIAITLAQKLPQSKAIIVITPQKTAVADGRKAASLYRTEGLNIPILGVVENMSWFVPEKHPDEKYILFGQGGGKSLADDLQVPLLAQIPLISDVCELGDTGMSVFASTHKVIIDAFTQLAQIVSNAEILKQ